MLLAKKVCLKAIVRPYLVRIVLDTSRLRVDERKLILIPFESTPSEIRLNFEGLLAYNPHSPNIGHMQLFRNGTLKRLTLAC
jgi:hypothetical protein